MPQPYYSDRKYENKLAYHYYKFPEELRAELYRIFSETTNPFQQSSIMQEISDRVKGKCREEEFGVFADLERFYRKAPSIYILDAVEIFLSIMFKEERRKERVEEVVESINKAFHDYNVGFYVLGGIVVREGSRYYDAKVIRQVYELLFAPGFEEALVNFQHTLGWLRHSPPNYDAVAYYAQAALRATVGTLLERHINAGSSAGDCTLHEAVARLCETSGASALSGEIARRISAIFPDLMDVCRRSSSVNPELRSPEITPVFARFAVNMMAAGIMFLMQLNGAMLLSGKMSEWDMFE